MDSKHKVQIFVTADCLCIFQMFESTLRPDFFLTLTLLCTLYNQLKFCLRMLILRGLNGLEPKKFEFSSPPKVLTFFLKKHNLAQMFYENNFYKNYIFNFFSEKTVFVRYLCKYTNLFPILKNSLGSTFFELYRNFFCEVFEDPK
jgi:hypothetical protein